MARKRYSAEQIIVRLREVLEQLSLRLKINITSHALDLSEKSPSSF